MQRIFERKGVVTVAKSYEVPGEGRKTETREVNEDELLEATIEANVEDVADNGDEFELTSDPNDMVEVRKAVQAAGIDYNAADVAFVATFDQDIDTGLRRTGVPVSLEEAAWVDGASAMQALRSIVLPLIAVSTLFFVFQNTIEFRGVPFLMKDLTSPVAGIQA